MKSVVGLQIKPGCRLQRLRAPYVPQEAVEVAVPHVFEHHGQRLAIGAHAVEANDVLVLQHSQKLRLPLKVLPGRLVGIFQGLWTHTHTYRTCSRLDVDGRCRAKTRWRCLILSLSRKPKSNKNIGLINGLINERLRFCINPLQRVAHIKPQQ